MPVIVTDGSRIYFTEHGSGPTRSALYQVFESGGETSAVPTASPGNVLQHLPKPRNCSVQPTIEINEGTVRPEAANQFVTRHEFAGLFEQREQYLPWLLLNSQTQAVHTQLSVSDVRLEGPETDDGRQCVRL
jgi:hypothetical protein